MVIYLSAPYILLQQLKQFKSPNNVSSSSLLPTNDDEETLNLDENENKFFSEFQKKILKEKKKKGYISVGRQKGFSF